MTAKKVAQRLVWAVETLAVEPEDRLLEIGCGQGVAASLVCEKLDGGTITAIDRSEKMIEAARKHNADHVAADKASFRTTSLDRADFGDARFDKIFAINAGIFWRRQPVRELEIIGEHLAPDGRLFLFHEPPPGSSGPPDARPAVALLESNGFSVTEVLHEDLGRTHAGCVTAEKGPAPAQATRR
jgi:cyclopropane fatty-acyl-phospholipid synthase-like methyltransferase